jgi:hypothetical protein
VKVVQPGDEVSNVYNSEVQEVKVVQPGDEVPNVYNSAAGSKGRATRP